MMQEAANPPYVNVHHHSSDMQMGCMRALILAASVIKRIVYGNEALLAFG